MRNLGKLSFICITLVALLFFSCKNEAEKADAETATEATSAEEMKESVTKSSELKYNPAHGEEGHRCDLPVGAPLDKASANTTQEMTQSPLRLKSATPKINPPHGEPGHDCSVAVGAPLN